MFFAKSSIAAAEFEDELMLDKVKKVYLARARGDMRTLGETVEVKKRIYMLTPFQFGTEPSTEAIEEEKLAGKG